MNKEDSTPPPQKKKFTFDRNAKGVRELLSMKFDVMDFKGPWYDAFGTPVVLAVWHTTVWRKVPAAPCRMPSGVQE